MQLVTPAREHLPDYIEALRKGWSPDTTRPEVALEQLERIANDPAHFLSSFTDLEAQGGPVTLPDGSTVPRLPSLRRWVWQDGFCGSIGLRWQKGTHDLPPTCLGHLGYAIVPWRRREGLCTEAVRAMLPLAKAQGLRFVEVTTDPQNHASIGVVEKAGGQLIESVVTPSQLGGRTVLRFHLQT